MAHTQKPTLVWPASGFCHEDKVVITAVPQPESVGIL